MIYKVDLSEENGFAEVFSMGYYIESPEKALGQLEIGNSIESIFINLNTSDVEELIKALTLLKKDLEQDENEILKTKI